MSKAEPAEQERQAFETWADGLSLNRDDHRPDSYNDARVDLAWCAWQARARRASAPNTDVQSLRVWLRNNMTFYNTANQLVPTLAAVSKRIWYHATDDTESYPFDAVADAALKDQGS